MRLRTDAIAFLQEVVPCELTVEVGVPLGMSLRQTKMSGDVEKNLRMCWLWKVGMTSVIE